MIGIRAFGAAIAAGAASTFADAFSDAPSSIAARDPHVFLRLVRSDFFDSDSFLGNEMVSKLEQSRSASRKPPHLGFATWNAAPASRCAPQTPNNSLRGS
jgi:hypothetical protein